MISRLEELCLESGKGAADPKVNFLASVYTFRFVFVGENQ